MQIFLQKFRNWRKLTELFAYVKKKQYLCTRFEKSSKGNMIEDGFDCLQPR